ncbi:MAG: MMPL family transporter [Phycisphaerales bacterium]|nr:MAG: MMPL family transporter [Phycisphaerales bacterium]
MRSYFRFITSRPVPVLVIVAIVAGISGSFMLRLTREVSPDAFIPPDHPALTLKKQVDGAFGLKEPIAIGVIRDKPGGIFNPSTLRLIQLLTQSIQQIPQIDPKDVLSIFTESGVFFEDGEPGFDLLIRDIPENPDELERLKDEILAYELYQGTLLAKDASAACIIIRPSDERQADALYRNLRRLLDSSDITRHIQQGERLVVAGEAAVRAHMGKAVSDDALRMNFVCPVVMILLIILAYRTVRGTFLPLCVIGGASSLALGLMAASGVPIYIVTNGIFVIIMALGVADSLHLLGQYYEEQLDVAGRDKQELIVDACMALWYPLLITTLTDFAGFFALFLVGRMPPIEYFGLFTCIGVLGALVYSYTVIPAGLMVVPLKMSRAFAARKTDVQASGGLDAAGAVMRRIGSLTFHRRRAVLAVSGVLIAVACWGASKLIVNDARILAFKESHPIVQANNALNERFDGTSHLNIVVHASQSAAMLQADVLRKVEALEAFTETLPHVGGTHSLAGWIKRAHQKLNDERPEFYAIPDDPLETQFYLDVLSDKETSPMAHLLSEVVDETYTNCNLIIRMRSSEFIHQREVIWRLEQYLDEEFNDDSIKAELSGRVHLDYHWLQMIRTTHLNSVVVSIACVLLLTGLMFRSVVAGILCTVTVALAVLVNYAIMSLSGIPLGVGTSMFASIAIGAGVNFPIHILDRLRIGLHAPDTEPANVFADTLAFTGRALFFTAFVVAVGFLLLCVSEFRTLVRFGLLIGVGMIVSFLASVFLLPAVVAVTKPGFVWDGCTPVAKPGENDARPGGDHTRR